MNGVWKTKFQLCPVVKEKDEKPPCVSIFESGRWLVPLGGASHPLICAVVYNERLARRLDLVLPSKASRRAAGGINCLTLFFQNKASVSWCPIRGIAEERETRCIVVTDCAWLPPSLPLRIYQSVFYIYSSLAQTRSNGPSAARSSNPPIDKPLGPLGTSLRRLCQAGVILSACWTADR